MNLKSSHLIGTINLEWVSGHIDAVDFLRGGYQ